ncbi:3850_t:CDS:2 [Racocetra fulgida]|uniref:3850_t:CDS:1 n=1 Tax=Racocetra fulgida TaxID=60492 RepID=A0A9N8ZCI6_9GLOM|nr:3850_t:CDS:2 [Racocetra fulgida]
MLVIGENYTSQMLQKLLKNLKLNNKLFPVLLIVFDGDFNVIFAKHNFKLNDEIYDIVKDLELYVEVMDKQDGADQLKDWEDSPIFKIKRNTSKILNSINDYVTFEKDDANIRTDLESN